MAVLTILPTVSIHLQHFLGQNQEAIANNRHNQEAVRKGLMYRVHFLLDPLKIV